MHQRTKNKTSVNNDALIAAAFQQHLQRQIETSLAIPGLERLQNLNKRSPPRKKEVKSVVDSGLNALKAPKKKKKAEPLLPQRKERVLAEGRQPQPTLAQRLGLVEGPPSSLTENQWKLRKEACVRRGDIEQPCPICHEEFARQSTILLSCSHLFHRACLDAFERFSGKKTCPMCRREEYQKRIIYEGETVYLIKCATKIQACWRGHHVRRWYREYRRRNPPKDPRLRQRWSEDRLTEVTDRAIASVEALRVDAFLDEIDASLALSKRVFERWERRKLGDSEWAAVEKKALDRGDSSCPICLITLSPASRGKNDDGGRVLLSCSHMLHARCLETLEKMAEECGVGDKERACPVCRAVYTKRRLDVVDDGKPEDRAPSSHLKALRLLAHHRRDINI